MNRKKIVRILLRVLIAIVLLGLFIVIGMGKDTEKYEDFLEILILLLAIKVVLQHLKYKKRFDGLDYKIKNYEALINVLPDMIFVYSREGVYLDFQALQDSKLLLSKEAFIGKHISEVMPKNVTKKTLIGIRKTLSEKEIVEFEYQLTIGDKLNFFETRMVNHTEDSVLAIVRDITEVKKRRKLIEELSYQDQLTKVYNRRYFDEKMLEFDEESYLPLAIIMIDVNGLKLTNDAFGHIAGDELLLKVASNLKETDLGDEGFIARIGGDEFVAIIPNTEEVIVEKYVQSIRNRLSLESVVDIPISISIGWDIRLEMSISWDEIFISAEDEMFRMKLTESRSARHSVISVIMNSLNTKNERERKHSECVSMLSRKIAEFMSLSDEIVRDIETAGLLHDIGKIGIRQDILNKEGKLTEKEYDEVKKHPESGYQILRSVDSYASLANTVLCHHERIDGKGYPRGMKGHEIPLEAKIIMVADAYEAMRANRSYRKGMNHNLAVEELLRYSGTQFDKEIVKVFIEKFDEEDYIKFCNRKEG